MPMRMNLWHVEGEELEEVRPTRLSLEERLEKWIVDNPSILGMDVLIIGKQVLTEHGGRVDLLGIDRQGDTIIIELKRDRTPRDVIAQVLDYATWIKGLSYAELNGLALNFLEKSISAAFVERFGESLPDTVNSGHSMVVVASELDDASERIVQYLANEHGVNINAIFFSFFTTGSDEYVGRAWLMDPEEMQERSESRKQPPWSGYWFVNVGEGPNRNWDDNRAYGYIGAGQGLRRAHALQRLSEGDEILAYMGGLGYVGYGKVTKTAMMINDFVVEEDAKPLLQHSLKAVNAGENSEDPDLSEWAVGVSWLKVFPRDQAKTFRGIFANQNVVCKLRHQATLDFLKTEFGVA